MHAKNFKQQGLSLLEMLIAVSIAGVLMAAISGVIGNALNAERSTRLQNEAMQQTSYALQIMSHAVRKTRRLMIPLGENPATAWTESERDVLAVTLDPTLDRDKDGWADANNDKDFLDVNNNGSHDAGEPERIDEDLANDNTNDLAPGIVGIDDNGDGVIDNSSALTPTVDNDEDNAETEDSINNIDTDNDGAIDEDIQQDMNMDIGPGIKGFDDDFDGSVDEGNNDDDDEDGARGEDWYDPVVFFLNGTTLMQRIPNINPVDGTDYTEYPIADNVTQLLVKRLIGGNGSTVLVDITLTLSAPDTEPVTLNTTIGVGSGL